MRLDRAIEEYEKANGSARQALLLADEATATGDATRRCSSTQAAEAFANRIIAFENEVADLKRCCSSRPRRTPTQAKQRGAAELDRRCRRS